MSNNKTHFFQQFFAPGNAHVEQKNPEYIIHNETVLEIINNWEFALDLFRRYKEGKLQQVDQLEHTWYNFLIGNTINIESYKTKEEFLDAFWRLPG